MKTAIHVNFEDYFTIPDSLPSNEVLNLKKLGKKNTFQCPFCKAFLEVISGPERSPYFRHRHSESCEAYEEFEKRSATYTKQTARENTRHSVVISFLKNELKLLGMLYTQLQVIEGRFDPNFQSFIPDLVVHLNQTYYTISIITQVNATTDESLSKELTNRKKYFEDKGYISLWFVERTHATTEITGQEIVLWLTEQVILASSSEDKNWSTFLRSFTSAELLTNILGLNKPLSSLDVQSIYYLSANDNSKFELFRTIQEANTVPTRALIIGTPYELTIQEMFKIKIDSFLLENPALDDNARILYKEMYDQHSLAYLQEQELIETNKNINKEPKASDLHAATTLATYKIDSIKLSEEKKTAIQEYKLYLRKFTLEEERLNIPLQHLSLFDIYIKKYHLTTVNFPGICKTYIFENEKIPLPVTLWQLWIMDKILTVYQSEPLTASSLAKRFSYQFNINRGHIGPIRMAFDRYLWMLEQLGILGHRKSEFYKEPYPINIHTLPLIKSLKENSYIAFYFSNHYYADDPFGKEAKESYLKYKNLISVK